MKDAPASPAVDLTDHMRTHNLARLGSPPTPIDFDLSAYMRTHGIIRISDNGHGFSVYMRGDILGTGATVGEALANGFAQRNARKVEA